MGLMKLFPRWMLFSTTLPLQIAVSWGISLLDQAFKNLLLFFLIVDINIKQNLKLLNLSIYM